MYNGEPKPEPELETEPEPENLLKPSWNCMSQTSPTLRLPKKDATLGPPDGQAQTEAYVQESREASGVRTRIDEQAWW